MNRLESMFPHWWPDNNVTDDPANRNRAFARSDDGGATWAELWYLADRHHQPPHTLTLTRTLSLSRTRP